MDVINKIDKYLNESQKYAFVVDYRLSGEKLIEKGEKILKDVGAFEKTFSAKESDKIAKKIIDKYGRNVLNNLIIKTQI